MSVTKEDVQKIEKKVDDHRKEMYDNIFENITKPINQLTLDLREMLVEFRNQKEATGRLSKEIKEVKEKQAEIDKVVTVIKTKQDSMFGIGGKLLPIVIIAIISLSGTLQVLSYTSNQDRASR